MRVAVLGVLLAGCAAWFGCKKEAEAPAASYAVRGQVKSLPSAADKEIFIHHEAIPSFRSQEGTEIGMDSMSMPFTVDKALSLEGIAPGDAVRFAFEVRWDARPTTRVVAIEKLPPGTELELSGL
jgi:Cu/Ag efflux protein CusF